MADKALPKTGTFVPYVTFRCPCGGEASAGEEVTASVYCVIHADPQCAEFLGLEPTDYIRWAREHGAVNVKVYYNENVPRRADHDLN